MPFLKQLLKKMSANDVDMMQRMPMSLIAHGACSRLLPHPKLSPATCTKWNQTACPNKHGKSANSSYALGRGHYRACRSHQNACITVLRLVQNKIRVLIASLWVIAKLIEGTDTQASPFDGLQDGSKPRLVRTTSTPSHCISFPAKELWKGLGLYRNELREVPTLRNCFGMIMSVSTFWMSSGATVPDRVVNLGIPAAQALELAADAAAGAAPGMTCAHKQP